MVELGRLLGMRLHAGDVVLLSGDLGAGKTTLMRGLGEGLGVRGPVTSPTFVIARRHPSLVGGPDLIHADAYRLGSAGEFEDLDLADDQAVVCVEWGRDRAEQLSARRLEIDIETAGDGRTVRITGIGRTVPL
jgi:tRNA threonylcarbamoyladenosine biosynthesis protein TsaE